MTNIKNIILKRPFLSLFVLLVIFIVLISGAFYISIPVFQYMDVQNILKQAKLQTKGQFNAEARGYLTAAEAITNKYIIPMGLDKGAYENSQTFIYKQRDELYNKGMSLLPPDDGEREIWWWKIRYKEYADVYGQLLSSKYKAWELLTIVPEGQEREKYLEWDQEILKHIKAFPDAVPVDKQFLKEKFSMFIDMLQSYAYKTTFINDLYDLKTDDKTKAQKLKTILEAVDESYNHYKSFVNQKEKEGVDYVNNQPELVLNELSYREKVAKELVGAYQTLGQLDCNNKYFDIYTDSVYEKLAYLKVHEKTLSPSASLYFGIYTHGIHGGKDPKTRDQKHIAFNEKCKNQQGYKKYYQFLKETAINKEDYK